MKKKIITTVFIIAIIILLGFYIIISKENKEIVAKNAKMNLILNEESENIFSDSKNDVENENIITNISNEAENVIQENLIQNPEETQVQSQDKIYDTQKENVIDVQENKDSLIDESENEVQYIDGFEVVGYMKIPKFNIDAPIFRNVTVRTLEISIALAMGNLNEIGNTTIFGHAYKNYPFEKISELENGDILVIKDSNKREITYEVYDKQIINSQDATYMIRDTNGTREISMQTGAPDNKKLIVLAREVNVK